MKTGNRKVILAALYLAGCFGIAVLEVLNKPDAGQLAALGGTFTGIAAGLGTFMWGNSKEHEHDAKAPAVNTPSQ